MPTRKFTDRRGGVVCGARLRPKHIGNERVAGVILPVDLAPLPSPGRNKPCPCGSGKKWKKCHGVSVSPPPPRTNDEVFAEALGRPRQ